jgi:hypothetical protein
MTLSAPSKDLVVLTADKNAQFAVQGILSRFKSLSIRQLETDYYVHPEKDPGVLHHAHDFLRPFSKSHEHALVLMDREGSGQEETSREALQQGIENELNASGWNGRAAAVVIDPEIDIWVWSDSPHVDHELGWSNHVPALRTWLREKGFLPRDVVKPQRPKEALETALREVKMPRSSAIYRALAEKVSLSRCTDPAFGKLKSVLQMWFPKV